MRWSRPRFLAMAIGGAVLLAGYFGTSLSSNREQQSEQSFLCGIALVTVEGPNGSMIVQTGLETPRLWGRNIDADKLVAMIRKRIRAMEGGPEVHYSHERTRSESEVSLAIALLSSSKDPRALSLLSKLLQDPWMGMRGHAAAGLGELGDPRALRVLEAAVRSGKPFNGTLTPALLRIGDPRAIDVLVDTFDPAAGIECSRRLEAIEQLSGESMARLQPTKHRDLRKVGLLLRIWWEERTNRMAAPLDASATP